MCVCAAEDTEQRKRMRSFFISRAAPRLNTSLSEANAANLLYARLDEGHTHTHSAVSALVAAVECSLTFDARLRQVGL